MLPEIDQPTTAPQFPLEFRTLVEDFRAILWEIDYPAHRFTWVSRHAEEVLGYRVEEWLEQPGFWENHIHPADRGSVLASCKRVGAEDEDHQFEYRMIAIDGRIVWLRHIVRIVKDSHGQTSKLRGVMVDITEQRAAQQALRDSEERFRKIFQESPIAMNLVGRDSRVKAVNQAFCTMLGMEEWELTKMTTPEFIHPDDRAQRGEMIGHLFDGTIPSYKAQKRYIKATGEIIWVEVFGTLIRDASGDPLYGLGIAVDITGHKRAEQTLRELSARLMRLQEEERRRIARELHDSTGQNLAALKLNLSRLDRAHLAPDLKGVVSDSLVLADRMLSEIRTLSHLLHPPLLDELGLASAIRTYVEGFRERSGIGVYLNVPENLGRHTPELETAIFRIIQEGLTNIYRHSGGTQCWITMRLEGETLQLDLRDDGTGLRMEALEDLEGGAPAFGVGLSGMRERARQLRGHLTIESTGSGCLLRTVFPVNT
jgi:PAS domain S-box-containing protein